MLGIYRVGRFPTVAPLTLLPRRCTLKALSKREDGQSQHAFGAGSSRRRMAVMFSPPLRRQMLDSHLEKPVSVKAR